MKFRAEGREGRGTSLLNYLISVWDLFHQLGTGPNGKVKRQKLKVSAISRWRPPASRAGTRQSCVAGKMEIMRCRISRRQHRSISQRLSSATESSLQYSQRPKQVRHDRLLSGTFGIVFRFYLKNGGEIMEKEHLAWIRTYLKNIYRTPILENFLQLKVVEVGEGKFTCQMKAIDKHCNIYGSIHGGTLASISDIAMGVACITMGRRVVTIDMNISYIKKTPVGSTLTATGEVVSSGKSIMRAACQIFNEKKELLVRSQASYFVIGDFCEKDFPQIAGAHLSQLPVPTRPGRCQERR